MAPAPKHLSTPETASFWAKTGDKDSPTRGLSLVQHMLDAGSVAARLGHMARPRPAGAIQRAPPPFYGRYSRTCMLARRHP